MGGKTTEYLQGVKQMICHWIGVNKGAVDDSLREKLHSYKRRLLGTVVYDNPNTQKKYGKLYEKLRTYLNELSDIEVMPLITYQDLIKQNPNLINRTIADFYGLSPDA